MKLVGLIANILLVFLSALAPLMFLVAVIAGLDRYGTHNRFVRNLEQYGLETTATVSYTDPQNGRFGVDYLSPNGEPRFGSVDTRYYPPEAWQSLQTGDSVRIRYINAIVTESDRAALAGYYASVRAFPLIPADVLWMLGLSWLLVMFKPQFVFLGLLNAETLLTDAFA